MGKKSPEEILKALKDLQIDPEDVVAMAAPIKCQERYCSRGYEGPAIVIDPPPEQ